MVSPSREVRVYTELPKNPVAGDYYLDPLATDGEALSIAMYDGQKWVPYRGSMVGMRTYLIQEEP